MGKRHAVSVLDAATGRQLYAAKPHTCTPASTSRSRPRSPRSPRAAPTTGSRRAPSAATRTRSCSSAAATRRSARTQLRDLARTTARKLREDGTAKVTLRYDTSRYSGPERHPIGQNDNLAPVTPLMVDEGRLKDVSHGPSPRPPDPASDAAEAFADALGKHGIDVKGKPKKSGAPGKAKELAVHRSAPLSTLVERMLTNSDNDIAEALARQTALASGERAGFDGAAKAVTAPPRRSSACPLKGARFADGSGLDRADKVTAGPAHRAARHGPPTRTTRAAPGPHGPAGRRLHRHPRQPLQRSDGEPAAGLVRAKTGTLTGVNALAGTVVDADGRLLAFAFLASGTADGKSAQAALDRLAAALANCGCRDSPSEG